MQRFVAQSFNAEAGLRALESLRHERVLFASANSIGNAQERRSATAERKVIVLRYPTLPEKLCRSPLPFSGRLGFGPSLRNANTGERYPGGRIACGKRFDQAHQDEFVLNRGRFNFTGELGFGPALVTLMARSSLRHHRSA